MGYKLNVLLAKKQHALSIFHKMVEDLTLYFKNKQSPFKGKRMTYTPVDANPINPAYEGHERVVTTVAKKLQYFEEHGGKYFDHFMSVEATNATAAKADLIIRGKKLATLSTMELLALKSHVQNTKLRLMYEEMPTRSDTKKWIKVNDPEYKEEEHIYTHEATHGTDKTGTTKTFILSDPNVQYLTDTSKYTPVTSTMKEDIIFGHYTIEHFSGELSHEERAAMLARLSEWYDAVIEALQRANNIEAVPSELKASQFYDFIHRGKIE